VLVNSDGYQQPGWSIPGSGPRIGYSVWGMQNLVVSFRRLDSDFELLYYMMNQRLKDPAASSIESRRYVSLHKVVITFS
jgi:hypothetical protein